MWVGFHTDGVLAMFGSGSELAALVKTKESIGNNNTLHHSQSIIGS